MIEFLPPRSGAPFEPLHSAEQGDYWGLTFYMSPQVALQLDTLQAFYGVSVAEALHQAAGLVDFEATDKPEAWYIIRRDGLTGTAERLEPVLSESATLPDMSSWGCVTVDVSNEDKRRLEASITPEDMSIYLDRALSHYMLCHDNVLSGHQLAVVKDKRLTEILLHGAEETALAEAIERWNG